MCQVIVPARGPIIGSEGSLEKLLSPDSVQPYLGSFLISGQPSFAHLGTINLMIIGWQGSPSPSAHLPPPPPYAPPCWVVLHKTGGRRVGIGTPPPPRFCFCGPLRIHCLRKSDILIVWILRTLTNMSSSPDRGRIGHPCPWTFSHVRTWLKKLAHCQ